MSATEEHVDAAPAIDETETQNEEETQEITDPSDALVLTKYKKAAEIAALALNSALTQCKVGAPIAEICIATDALIVQHVATQYASNKKMERGIAFPTCISCNHCVGHFSPLVDDEPKAVLQAGDLVKIDLGVHIDGYAALQAHSFVLPKSAASVEAPKADATTATEATPAPAAAAAATNGSTATVSKDVTGKSADVLMAASVAHDALLRMIKPGVKNTELTQLIAKVCASYKVSAVQGVLSHTLQRFIVDGSRCIINKAPVDDTSDKVEEVELRQHDVYAIDLLVSSGDGKPKALNDRCTVFKRNPQAQYQLKMKASRGVLLEIKKHHPSYPFSFRALQEPTKAKFALKECRQHDLVNAFIPLYEKEGEQVAHCKFTVLLTERGCVKLCGKPIDTQFVHSEHKLIDEEIKQLLTQPLQSATSAANAKKRAKAKAKAAAAAAAAASPKK